MTGDVTGDVTGVGRDPVLTVSGLSIAFDGPAGRVPAVSDLSLDLTPGRVLALVGESGSGKSVTALAALGLLPDTAAVTGSIRLEGDELVGASRERLRRVRGGRIGTVFQEPAGAFNPILTVGEQIAEAVRLHRGGDRATVRSRVVQLLAGVGLDEPDRVRTAYPHQLSGGQLQRAMIAMATSADPAVLIADEPTTALDVTVQAGILDLLRDLTGRLGTAVLLITHDMGVVADLADDVVVLRDGREVERGAVEDLFARPTTAYTRELLAAVPALGRLAPVAVGTGDPVEVPADPGDPVAVLDDVRIEYRARRRAPVRAVDGVSLEIDRGRVLGLVGESGSGKSTLGRALAGLVQVAAGRVEVAGTDVTRASRAAWRPVRRRIGIVYQDPASSLNPRRTVADSVAEPITVHTDVRGAALDTRVGELLDAVRLGRDLGSRYPHEMSGGQRQRVAIARALALNPDLLIADEPTSALDVSVQARVLDLFRELQERYGFGCLFVSHDLAVVERLADEVAVLHHGRVVERGPVARVLGAPRHPYTRRLLAAAPVADPVAQRERREVRRALLDEAAAS